MTEPSSIRGNVTGGFIARSSGTWVQTSEGWFASTWAVAAGGPIQDLFLYDHEGMTSRQVPPATVISAEDVESEALYNGHWIPLVSMWKDDSTRIHAPIASSLIGYCAVLYLYSSPEWEALVSLPRAEVHDQRGGNGGVSFRVPLTEIEGDRHAALRCFDAGVVLMDTYRHIRWRFASDLDAARFSWIAPLAWTDIRAEFGWSEEAP